MARAGISRVHLAAAIVMAAGTLTLSKVSAQRAGDMNDAGPLDLCIRSLTNARQRIDALARRPAATCQSIDLIRRDRDDAVAALARLVKARAALPQGCGDLTVDIRFGGGRPIVEARGSARDPVAAGRRIEETVRDLGLDRGDIDFRPADACGLRLPGDYVVVTSESGNLPEVKDRPSAREMDRLPEVDACENLGQALVEAKLAPLRFWVRTPSGQLAQCYRQGDGSFTWIDFNSGEAALVIQRGPR
jgi:hypothetical protein